MTTIVTRAGKGSTLSWAEMDANLNNLNNDKIETSDIGVSVQAYDSTTTKNTATQTLTNKTIISSGSNTIEATSGPDGSQLAGFRNKIINGDFRVNQRVYVSGASVGTNLYGHDRWKMAASADTYTFSTTNNNTTVTIPSGKVLRQVIEGVNLQTGTYTLSWKGTAQGKIGAGALSASGVTGSITGGTDTTIEFGPGTVANVQLEIGSIATPFEQRPIGLELALCQRYYEKQQVGDVMYVIGSGTGFGSSHSWCVQKRVTNPTLSFTIISSTNVTNFGYSSYGNTSFIQSGIAVTTGTCVAIADVIASAEL